MTLREMLKFVPSIGLIALFSLLALSSQPANVASANGGAIPEHYIVKIEPSANPASVAQEHGLQMGHAYSHVFTGFSVRIPEARLEKLRNDSRVISIVEDVAVTIAAPPCGKPKKPPCPDPTPEPTPDPGDGSGKERVPTGIMRINAAGTGTYNVPVAVIDTGIDTSHPDLNVVGGINCQNGNRKRYNDGNGHGTHVAGTIGALDNNMGVVGVAPGTPLYAVRVLDDNGSGTFSSIICGLDWVTSRAKTIKVANMSLGGLGGAGSCESGGLREAVCSAVNAGITVVVAAGNSADDAAKYVPASYDEAITVSALADFDGLSGALGSATCRNDQDDTFANFSNYGADVDIIAPGVCIESTWTNGGYTSISGTSMAAPHVAGAAALYVSSNPGSSPAQVKAGLIASASTDWNNVDDRDNIKEPLLNINSVWESGEQSASLSSFLIDDSVDSGTSLETNSDNEATETVSNNEATETVSNNQATETVSNNQATETVSNNQATETVSNNEVDNGNDSSRSISREVSSENLKLYLPLMSSE